MMKTTMTALVLSIFSLAAFTKADSEQQPCLLNAPTMEEDYSTQPPDGHTGSDGAICSDCHSSGGNGSVDLAGLPASIAPNTDYDLTLKVAHAITGTQAPRIRWGFAINTRYGTGTGGVGTFSTTNPNAVVNSSDELVHQNAPFTPAAADYTFTNLRWRSPATITGPITFYIVGNAANGNGSSGGDFIYANTTTVGTLPVKFGSIAALVANDKNVHLKWNTLREENTSHFDIEESIDNISFQKIARVNAIGQSNTQQNYSFVYTRPGAFNKTLFYRLKIIDKDGKFEYSPYATIRIDASTDFVKGINPSVIASGQSANMLVVSSKQQPLNWQIMNAAGQRISQSNTQLTAGNNTLSIDTKGLVSGRYYVVLQFADNTQTTSLVVQ
jgi:hypothetical protein